MNLDKGVIEVSVWLPWQPVVTLVTGYVAKEPMVLRNLHAKYKLHTT